MIEACGAVERCRGLWYGVQHRWNNEEDTWVSEIVFLKPVCDEPSGMPDYKSNRVRIKEAVKSIDASDVRIDISLMRREPGFSKRSIRYASLASQ